MELSHKIDVRKAGISMEYVLTARKLNIAISYKVKTGK
jgi:hypothetical protein